MKFSICLFLATAVKLVSARDDIHVLMYETDESIEEDPTSPLSFFKQRSSFADLPTTIYGSGLEYHGFGDKYQTLRAILEVIDPSKLVVVADARDVALNIPENTEAANKAIDRFIDTYNKLTVNDPHAVVMSAESQCCVSAMTHAHPTEYFDPITKKRTKRACSSGKPGCYWNQNENIYAWVDFHRQRAYNRTGIERVGNHVGDVYLNAGLMAGYPEDMINLLDILDIAPAEDDQAVLSGLMYQFPEMIVLDYDQEIFGNNQWPQGLEHGCVFEKSIEDEVPTQSTLAHSWTKTEPLIIHTPGKFYGCLDILIEELGGTSQQRYLQESPEGNPRILRREGKAVFKKKKPDDTNYRATKPAARKLEEDCECTCESSGRRRLLGIIARTFTSIKGSLLAPRMATERLKAYFGDDEPEPKAYFDDKYFENLILEETFVALDEVEEPEDENYGNYGGYGQYVALDEVEESEDENYGNYGGYGQYGVAEENYGQYGVAVETRADTNYGNYGEYEVTGGYGNYGGYGQYGVSEENYGGYGQYGSVSSRSSQYGEYGVVDDSCADICTAKCSESEDESTNYGGYGTYGEYGNYGQYGTVRRRRL